MLPEKEHPESEPLNVPLALMLTTAVDPSMSVPVHMPAAIRYALGLWPALTRDCDDGRAAERALRIVCIGSEKLLVCRFRRRRRARRIHLQFDGFGETQRTRSRGVSA